jgi:hypothetical protein
MDKRTMATVYPTIAQIRYYRRVHDRFWAVRTLSIYKGGFARRPLRGTAANSPTTARRAARNPSLKASA